MDEMNPTTCAVCKYQRKICEDNCVFARHFPPSRNGDFQNVQRLFGIQNMMKIVSSVEEDEVDKTLETLIVEAKIRAENPVHGPIAVEKRLSAEIDDAQKQLDAVRKMIEFFGTAQGNPSQ